MVSQCLPHNVTDILVTSKVELLDKAIVVLIHVEIKFNLCYDCLEAFLEEENIIWNTQAGFRICLLRFDWFL